MNTIKRYVLAIAVLVGVSTSLYAQNTASVSSVHATAKIINPLGLQKLTPLSFGTLIRPPSGTGTAVMSPSQIAPSLSTVTGGVATTMQGAIDPSTGHFYGPGPATFYAYGEDGFTFDVVLPSTVLMINRMGGSDHLNVHDFTTDHPGPNVLTKLLPTDQYGVFNFAVGATVDVPAAPISGTYFTGWYDGDFTVSVVYH